jgi:hypothetical protein
MYIGDNVEEPEDVDLLLHFGHPEHDEFSPPIYPISVHGVTDPGGPSAGIIDAGCDTGSTYGRDGTSVMQQFGFGEQAPEGFAHGDFGHDLVITHGDITITQHAGEDPGEFGCEIRPYG